VTTTNRLPRVRVRKDECTGEAEIVERGKKSRIVGGFPGMVSILKRLRGENFESSTTVADDDLKRNAKRHRLNRKGKGALKS